MRSLLLLLLAAFSSAAFAQKSVHIPNYLQNPNDVNGAQFTWSKTAQSTNFIIIWGNTVGTNPAVYPDPNLAFNPAAILDTMEYIYSEFKTLGFLDDAPGTNLSEYKIPIVIYGTWGANGAQGFANGGDADGIIGAFWVHPNAMHDGGVAAHELAHSLQAQAVIDYRSSHGLGPVWNNAGIFWESHANFMRNLLYPQFVTAWGMDVYHLETWGDWKNTYENYALLLAIMESEGIDMVNRLWRESLTTEYPLQAYKRLAGYTQAQFNDSLYLYARRMATYDFNYNNIGQYFRQYRAQDLQNYLPSIQNTFSILKKVAGADNRYEMPIEQAPEEFAYNVIPLYPESGDCPVIVKFKGHTEANIHTGWRYGFVAATPNGKVSRYSPVYDDNTGEIHFSLEGNETKMYLVVMGAPATQITTNVTNDTWQGYPKHFRFPYELTISGALPEGFQPGANFRSSLRTNGHAHSNGGGWVQNSASVSSSVYVGPMAMVLGNASLTGQVRVENTAVVRNATLSGQAKVLDNAFVQGGTYSGNAIIRGQAFVENATMSNNAVVGMRARVTNYKLSGSIEVGGDVLVYNQNGSCNNGVYYRLTNYYDDKLLECDGRTANHAANKDVNNTYTLFSNADMALQCSCGAGAPAIEVDSVTVSAPTCANAESGSVAVHLPASCGPFYYEWNNGSISGIGLDGLAAGEYNFTVSDDFGRTGVFTTTIPVASGFSAALSATTYDCSNATGAEATIALQGGEAPFVYQWNDGNSDASRENLAPGIYTVTVTDASACTSTGSVEVSISGQLEATLTTSPIRCHDSNDGSASFLPTNALEPLIWLWEGGSNGPSRENLSAGDYTVTVTDAAGCSASTSFTLSAPLPLSLQADAQNATCPESTDGSVSIDVSGGTPVYHYVWNTGDTTAAISSLAVGFYTVTVTDAAACSTTLQASVNTTGNLALSASLIGLACAGDSDGEMHIEVIGGTGTYQYLWNTQDTTADIVGLAAGTYTVTIHDAAGCSVMAIFTLTEPAPLQANLTAIPVSCYGASDGSMTLHMSGGTPEYRYLWDTQDTTATITSIDAGPRSVTVTDAHGCRAEWNFAITSPLPLNVTAQVTPASCYNGDDGAITVNVTGGTSSFQYQWSSGEEFKNLTQLTNGYYSLTVTDGNGCRDSISVIVESPDSLGVELTLPTLCYAASGDISASVSGGVGPYQYNWSTGQSGLVLNTGAGVYSFTVTDGNGCLASAKVTLLESDVIQPVLDITHASSASAQDGAIDMQDISGGTAPYQYLWDTGDSTTYLHDLAPGIYTLSITDAAGCTLVFSIQVLFTTAQHSPEETLQDARIVPNPSVAAAHLWLTAKDSRSIRVMVYNVLGQAVYEQRESLTEGFQVLELPQGLVSGVYQVVIESGKEVLVRRWLVQSDR